MTNNLESHPSVDHSQSDQTKAPDKQAKERLCERLNLALSEGSTLDQISEDLQQIDKPILVDFNNVLFNNMQPIVPNLESVDPLRKLKEIGTVVILTTSSNWQGVKQLLVEHGFWSDDMVLINAANFRDLMDRYGYEADSKAAQLRTQYMALARENHLFDNTAFAGKELDDQETWYGAPAEKKVAFAFMQPKLIPLIDDMAMATRANPGILGVPVTPWYSERDREEHGFGRDEEDPKYIGDVVEQIRHFYAQTETK